MREARRRRRSGRWRVVAIDGGKSLPVVLTGLERGIGGRIDRDAEKVA